MKSILLLLCLLSFLSTFLPAQTIRYVNHDASGIGDGSSWDNAFIRLQQALAVAQDGDEIWMAKGIYKPSTSNDRYEHYDLPSGVMVFGGFTGTETLLNQRDWVNNLTILSGDIGNLGDSTDNSFNILYSYSPNEKTRLDGLIFEEGNATNPDPAVDFHRPTRSGGGIYLDGEHFGYAQLSVVNCIFRRNRAHYQGGGIYANGREGGMAIVRLENCIFEQNVSETFGGGLSLENYFEQPFALELKDCEFRENYSLSNGNAIWLRAHQAVILKGCKFIRNSSIVGGTVYFNQLERNHPVEFSECIFKDNGQNAIFYYPFYEADNASSFKFLNCRFSGNSLPVIYIDFSTAVKINAAFEHCIFSRNANYSLINPSEKYIVKVLGLADEGGIVFTNSLFYKNIGREIYASSANINNCIIIDEPDPSGYNGIFWGFKPFHVKNSLFRMPNCNLLGGYLQSPTTVLCDSTNLFGIDPLFINPGSGPDADFRLQPCSPAINAGSNAILDSLGIHTDLNGNPRIRNGIVDMGPYETNISLHPIASALPSCAGASDGAIEFSPEICTPYNFAWSNGVTTGTNTEELAAGTYVFTATGSNNISVSDTIIISEPDPLVVNTEAHDVSCFEISDGWIEVAASGGTPNYTYTWDGIVIQYNLPVGTYSVTATDAHGCTGSAQASIGSPDQLQVFYTIQDASGPNIPDGSVVFDSITGGNNPGLPSSIFNLLPGNYGLTLTDEQGCFVIVHYTIGFTSHSNEVDLGSLLKLGPNPCAFAETASVEWSGNERAMLRVLNMQGEILEEKKIVANSYETFIAHWPPGVYQVEIRTESGRRMVRLLVLI